MSKQTKAQKITYIVTEIEKSVRMEEIYRKQLEDAEGLVRQAKQNLGAQVDVTRILKTSLAAETDTMRKGKGE